MNPEQYIDIHAHLDDAQYEASRENILTEFFALENSRLITVADPYDEKSCAITREMCSQFPRLQVMAAAHPHQANLYSPQVEKRIFSLMQLPNFLGIGEAGLDYHYQFSPPEEQKRVLARQIEIAAEAKLTLLLHSRKAEKEILAILRAHSFPLPVIFHCYTGNLEDAREILKRGFFISFSGIITFKNANESRSVLRQIPLERLFLETDSPYLAPEPYRGQSNSPLYIHLIYRKAVEVLGIEYGKLHEAVAENYLRAFRLEPAS